VHLTKQAIKEKDKDKALPCESQIGDLQRSKENG
jgi:hypothetical protein